MKITKNWSVKLVPPHLAKWRNFESKGWHVILPLQVSYFNGLDEEKRDVIEIEIGLLLFRIRFIKLKVV